MQYMCDTSSQYAPVLMNLAFLCSLNHIQLSALPRNESKKLWVIIVTCKASQIVSNFHLSSCYFSFLF